VLKQELLVHGAQQLRASRLERSGLPGAQPARAIRDAGGVVRGQTRRVRRGFRRLSGCCDGHAHILP
jgi:hypothetical protein